MTRQIPRNIKKSQNCTQKNIKFCINICEFRFVRSNKRSISIANTSCGGNNKYIAFKNAYSLVTL